MIYLYLILKSIEYILIENVCFNLIFYSYNIRKLRYFIDVFNIGIPVYVLDIICVRSKHKTHTHTAE
jgi:hypothetical protein